MSMTGRLVVLLLLCGCIGNATAQSASRSQLELYRSLDPQMQQWLRDEQGLEAGEGAEDSRADGRAARGAAEARNRGAESAAFGSDALAGGDLVLVEVDFIQSTPARTESAGPNLPPIQIPAVEAPDYSVEQREQFQRLIDSIRDRNPYRLDADGVLQLPGTLPIALSGLTEDKATKRLQLEPSFRLLDVKLTRIPVEPTGVEALKPFGYDLFDAPPSTFAPVTDVPVPSDYRVGAGDRLNIQLYGASNRLLRLRVSRDGQLNFPELGPIDVEGKDFETVRREIESRVAQQMIGTQASVSMGDTRSIRVFVVGEVRQPGSYTVSGLSSMLGALYAAGGIKETGSLRKIELKRDGQLVSQLDLYDLLLRGDTRDDARLLPGDVVFIPPVGSTVSVAGEVRRPAIYELSGPATLQDMLQMAGGVTPEADSQRLSILRLGDSGLRTALTGSLDRELSRDLRMQNGDILQVSRVSPVLDAGVRLMGHVYQPRTVAWREGLRLSEVIPSIDDLKPNADLGYVLVRRESEPDRRVVVLSADLVAALGTPGSEADLLLEARDQIIVFDGSVQRGVLLERLLVDLRTQADDRVAAQLVRISGPVRVPGLYPLEPGMRVSDLLRAGGRLSGAAYPALAELTRYRLVGTTQQTQLLQVDLEAIRAGDSSADIALFPFDELVIKEIPNWGQQSTITLAGEVRFPGRYPIREGETLRAVIERAGGLTLEADMRSAVFTRAELQQREAEQISRLTERLRSDLAAFAIQAGQAAEGAEASRGAASALNLVQELENVEPIGRLVIDLADVLGQEIGSRSDVLVRDGDQLVIPKVRQEITVLGEVRNATSHLYRAGQTVDHYLSLSGGLTSQANRREVYVVRADGSVSYARGGWFSGLSAREETLLPGDVIVAPLDTRDLPPLPFWQAVTGILYNSAVAIAAIGSL